MKYLLRFFFICILISLGIGYYLRSTDFVLGNKVIGFTVIFGIFIFMPLFLYHRWKGKKLKDYVLSQENLDKMKAKSPEKLDNQ